MIRDIDIALLRAFVTVIEQVPIAMAVMAPVVAFTEQIVGVVLV